MVFKACPWLYAQGLRGPYWMPGDQTQSPHARQASNQLTILSTAPTVRKILGNKRRGQRGNNSQMLALNLIRCNHGVTKELGVGRGRKEVSKISQVLWCLFFFNSKSQVCRT